MKLGAREVAMAGEVLLTLLTLVTEDTFMMDLGSLCEYGAGADWKNSLNSGMQST